jgi:hypothetical protein
MSNILKGLRRIVLNPKGNKYLKKYADNKALRDNPSQNPTQRLDGAGLRQCKRSQQYFIYK